MCLYLLANRALISSISPPPPGTGPFPLASDLAPAAPPAPKMAAARAAPASSLWRDASNTSCETQINVTNCLQPDGSIHPKPPGRFHEVFLSCGGAACEWLSLSRRTPFLNNHDTISCLSVESSYQVFWSTPQLSPSFPCTKLFERSHWNQFQNKPTFTKIDQVAEVKY